jgi:hypothetical protein
MHATVEVLLEAVFSTQSVQRGYKEDNWTETVKYGQESKGLGPEKDYTGEGQQHIQKTDLSSRQRGRPRKTRPNCQRVINIWSWAPEDLLIDWSSVTMWLWLNTLRTGIILIWFWLLNVADWSHNIMILGHAMLKHYTLHWQHDGAYFCVL